MDLRGLLGSSSQTMGARHTPAVFLHQVSGIHASDFAEDETTNGIRSLARIEAVLMVVTTMSTPQWIRLQRTGIELSGLARRLYSEYS